MKILFCLFLTMMTLTGWSQHRIYHVGDSAFCGIVFYVESINGSDLQHGLVCTPTDIGGQAAWYNGSYIQTFAISDRLYDKGNADTIIIRQGTTVSYAALSCRQFVSCGDGWYLPSVSELKVMYGNLAAKGIGQFANEGYWSSVEQSPSTDSSGVLSKNKAWIFDFYSGQALSVDKANNYHVRAVKEFRN